MPSDAKSAGKSHSTEEKCNCTKIVMRHIRGKAMELTFDRLNELLRYEPDTGKLFWKQSRGPRVRSGSEAGCMNGDGYICTRIDGKLYLAHRIAWFLIYKEMPSLQIDHINGIKNDNRIANLREVTPKQNMQNQRKPRVDNKSGYLGVSAKRKKWVSHIGIDGNVKHIGCFDTPEEAHEAYLKAKRTLHETCTI